MTHRILYLFAVAACTTSSPAIPTPRFVNTPAVQVLDDRMSTASPRKKDGSYLGYFDRTVIRPMVRPFELPSSRRARGVNALDEVPDSTWFTNRIGVRDMSLDELRRGPTTIENPDRHTPWTIHSSKTTGESAGLIVSDTRGERFFVKFDRRGYPELETANELITGRILWACGYNVPEDYIAHVRTRDFVIGSDAIAHDDLGHERRFSDKDLKSVLARIITSRDGQVRAMASRMLPGKALGGHSDEGVRGDDPNDRIPHELRRDLRGTLPIYAWLDNEDAKSDNTLDAWVSDAAYPDRHYVMHYFLDFGKALGGMGMLGSDPRAGLEYTFDAAPMWGSFMTLGMIPRPSDDRQEPLFRGLGLYDANSYRPASWRPLSTAYMPLLSADRFDWFWGAKIAMRFTPAQLRAIVDVGELSDPRAVDYLVKTLVTRQQMTAAYAFSRVSSLDAFSIDENHQVCFNDLVARYDLSSTTASYVVRLYDRRGRPLSRELPPAKTSAHTCTGPLPVARDGNAYSIVRITTLRGGHAHDVFVHVARAPLTPEWHVIGVLRA